MDPKPFLVLLEESRSGMSLRCLRSHLGKPGTAASLSAALANVETVHFLRLADVAGVGQPGAARRLLIAADVDGDLEVQVDRIAAVLGKFGLWGEFRLATEQGVLGALMASRIRPNATFRALPGQSREQLRFRLNRFKRINSWIRAPVGDSGSDELHRICVRIVKLAVDFYRVAHRVVAGRPATVLRSILAVSAVVRLLRLRGRKNVVRAALDVTRSLDRVPEYRLLNRLLRNSSLQPPQVPSQAQQGFWRTRPVLHDEDATSQNPLTLYSPISGEPEVMERLKATLELIDLYARQIAPPGRLLDIQTIHTAHWCILEKENSLLFASNYEGGWDGYIDEFCNMIGSGLDAIWGSDPMYPEAGHADPRALKQYLARRECETLFYFSAFPNDTLAHLNHQFGTVRTEA